MDIADVDLSTASVPVVDEWFDLDIRVSSVADEGDTMPDSTYASDACTTDILFSWTCPQMTS